MIAVARPLLGHEEEAAVHRVLASGQLAQGENLAAFEQCFAEACQVREAVALSSGTVVLHLALLAHNGSNLRMTEMQDALGVVQLEKLERFTEQRITNANFLKKRPRESAQTPIVRPGYRHVYEQYTIRVPEHRDEWAKRLGNGRI